MSMVVHFHPSKHEQQLYWDFGGKGTLESRPKQNKT